MRVCTHTHTRTRTHAQMRTCNINVLLALMMHARQIAAHIFGSNERNGCDHTWTRVVCTYSLMYTISVHVLLMPGIKLNSNLTQTPAAHERCKYMYARFCCCWCCRIVSDGHRCWWWWDATAVATTDNGVISQLNPIGFIPDGWVTPHRMQWNAIIALPTDWAAPMKIGVFNRLGKAQTKLPAQQQEEVWVCNKNTHALTLNGFYPCKWLADYNFRPKWSKVSAPIKRSTGLSWMRSWVLVEYAPRDCSWSVTTQTHTRTRTAFTRISLYWIANVGLKVESKCWRWIVPTTFV